MVSENSIISNNKYYHRVVDTYLNNTFRTKQK